MTAPKIVSIAVASLVVDPDRQARSRIDPNHVERLRNSDPETWPPLVVTPVGDGSGNFVVIDGLHRLQAGEGLANGKAVTSFPCRILQDAGYSESFTLNSNHPLTLSVGDRKERVLYLHQEYPSRSARQLAKEVGLGHAFVSKILAGEGSESGSPDPETIIRRLLAAMSSAFDALAGLPGGGGIGKTDIANAILSAKDPEKLVKAVGYFLMPLAEGVGSAEGQLAKDAEAAAQPAKGVPATLQALEKIRSA